MESAGHSSFQNSAGGNFPPPLPLAQPRRLAADREQFGIGRDRADLVLPGCAIFEAIRREWPTARVRVADRGLREGILISLMDADRGVGRPAAASGPAGNG